MAKVINLLNPPLPEATQVPLPQTISRLIEERKTSKRKPLSAAKVKGINGLENLSDAEAEKAVESIKALARILFEIHCHKESICIDNQHVVSLNRENKAA